MILLNRRLKRMYFCPTVLAMAGPAGKKLQIVSNDVPDSAQLRQVDYDPDQARFILILQDDSFDEVLPGDRLPILQGPKFEELD